MNFALSDEGLRPSESNGPTFEDLAIDDSLTDLQRVTKYVCSNIALQRVIHVKMLHETALSVGFQATCDQLLPLLEPLVCDVEYVVRQHVALQFPLLCQFLVEANVDVGYNLLLEKLIPLVSKLVSDDQHEVRSAASESLVEMAALIKQEDQGQHVLTIVLPLAHDDDNEQFRISAVSLYNGLAEHFGSELCQQFCVPELISLSEDPVFRVRKSTALSFPNVCKTAGVEMSRERLIPVFLRLAKDDIWGVRKACAECFVNVALALAPVDRGPLLIPLLESFINDSSRWVRMAAYQSLGPFLVALPYDQITDELVGHFTSMATTAASKLGGSGEVDIKFHCAFNFPALVSILGVSGWLKLSPTFELLHNDTYWKIRRSFAYSLHEMARILGQGITETQLATAFDSYLRDVQDVRLGAMLHFADFLENVSPSFRESYLPVLEEFISDNDITKWRFREVLSGQLARLCRTFTPGATFSVINPLIQKLITDPVYVVREQSYHACPLLVARLSSNPEWLDCVVDKFVTLAKSSHYQDRQCYAKVCASFLSTNFRDQNCGETTKDANLLEEARDFFLLKLAVTFFTLALDPVSNVRVVFCEIVFHNQQLCRDHPECLESLREILTASTTVSADDLTAALTDLVNKRLEAHVMEVKSTKYDRISSTTEAEQITGENAAEPKAKSYEPPEAASDVKNANQNSEDLVLVERLSAELDASSAHSTASPPVDAENASEPASLLQMTDSDKFAGHTPVQSVQAGTSELVVPLTNELLDLVVSTELPMSSDTNSEGSNSSSVDAVRVST
ncbi:Protein phosphatase 2A regulatory subunit A and related proteins [Plasmopara halstedii]|uniref:Protein phosphatase 2A regulatory subunit A and related proteins n=1 Tax=Plasmopara halstedii TaxID=4781 RepID=A0A0P1A7F6_PLAHL|nr:Protein phosphatase 2A regulatory subunit A and related proteins [Plasmopara halstedii]CEG36607.1 Protein phosphatase 2A regulatory subunit A and related proteins [Plasmopara halstedii]|eukprot:XP_024572976.1 Protein phosphatase 2A regulatory subunit A and related proteins [Plasmopara halstedii]